MEFKYLDSSINRGDGEEIADNIMRQSKNDTTFDREHSEERDIQPSNSKPHQNEDLDIDQLEEAEFEEHLLQKQNKSKNSKLEVQHSDGEESQGENSIAKEEFEEKLLEEQKHKNKMMRTGDEKEIQKEV